MSMRIFDFFKNARKSSRQQFITIVSGLPRSGTSMMMKMLESGGMEILTDNLRAADDDNPKGYFELERVKKLKDGDQEWLKDAQGKAIKVISALLEHLPPQYQYKLIFMRRHMDEILASQKQMLIRRGEPTDKVSDEMMAELFQKHLTQVEAWLAEQPNIEVIYINYKDVIQNPKDKINQVVQFLGGDFDIHAMQGVVDKNLYRQRR